MTLHAVTRAEQKPNCAKPELLPLVDAAFAKPAGPAGEAMRTRICPGCPVGQQCLSWAMGRREEGIWGGSSPNVRTRRGAPGKDGAQPSAASVPRIGARGAYRPKAAIGVPVRTLRAWALANGYDVHPHKGRISETIREAYDAAREDQAS